MKKLILLALALLAGGMLAPACSCEDDGVSQIPVNVVVDPARLEFGAVTIGRDRTLSFRVLNGSDAQVRISEVCIEGSDSPFTLDRSIGARCSGGNAEQVPARENLRFDVTFTPVAPAGNATDRVHIVTDAGEFDVELIAEGIESTAPEIEVCTQGPDETEPSCTDMPRLELGLIPVGQRSVGEVIIRSVGALPLRVIAAQLLTQGGAGAEFELGPAPLPDTVEPGEALRLQVAFSPTDGGEDRAVLQISSDASAQPLVEVAIVGTGDGPKICPEPSFLVDFGSVEVGSERTLEVVFVSCGTQPLEVTRLELLDEGPGEFTVELPTIPVSLGPAETLAMDVTYRPVNPGADEARLEVTSNDPDSPDGFIALRGNGTLGPVCALTAQPAPLDFGAVAAGQSLTRSVTVANQGQADCDISAVSIASGSSEFDLVAPPATPLTLAPGALQTIEVQFEAPTVSSAGATHQGTLRLESNDAVRPMFDIDLRGATGDGRGCAVDVQPTTLNFGDVALGSRSVLQLTITARSTCLMQEIATSLTSSPTFAVIGTSSMVPGLLLGGRTVVADVEFRPQVPGTETGTVEIKAGAFPQVVATVPLVARGLGPQLCLEPSSADFGILDTGQSSEREISLLSCGTDAVTVQSLQLSSSTSNEYSIIVDPGSVVLPPGDRATARLRYAPTNAGRDDGVLQVASNDPLFNVREARLIGVGVSPGEACGNIRGRICAREGDIYLAGARVFVEVGGQTIETLTDADGWFVLTCVPTGNQQVQVESGSWGTQFSANVNDRQTTELSTPQCIETDDVKIAVAYGQWDSIQDMLDRIGITYDLYEESAFPSVDDLLRDRALLFTYDILFLNCGTDETGIDVGGGPVRQNLIDYVAGGGSIYASDWSFDFVEVPWPDWVDFQNNDNDELDVQGGPNETVLGTMLDPGMAALVGRNPVSIDLCCSWIDAADTPNGAKIWVEGPRREYGGQVVPLMVSFEPTPGSGTVFYTPFHNADQTTSQREVDRMLQYIVFRL